MHYLMYEEEINKYLRIVAINRIKAYVKARFIKVFPEYDDEVDRILYNIQIGILCN